MERTDSNRVSVILVTCNSLPALKACLVSLEDGCAGVDWHLIVVDNASDDDSVVSVKQLRPDATVIENDSNQGFAAACNIGAARADGNFLLFLNPDVIMDKHALSRLLNAATTNIRVGALSGRLRNSDGSFQPTCRRFPSVTNLLFSRGSVFSRLLRQSGRYTLPDYESETIVPSVAGTMMMIRRSLFERVGGFDERFFMFLEDTDLCRRVRQTGYKNLFIPSAGGVHSWGRGSRASEAKRAVLHHSSMWKYFLKHLPNGFSLVVMPVLLIGNLLVTLISLQLRRVTNRDGGAG